MRLRRVDPSGAGIARTRRGKGWHYLDASGRAVHDAQTLSRIRSLAIPPAWSDVWISPAPNGHIQATGVDAAGRMQYIYHEEWRRRRDEEKFERMLGFARRLADLRRQVRRDLGSRELGRMQILACAVRLLDRGSFRVGTEVYTELNGSFGLSTLRKDHVRVGARSATFSYTAKGGKRREVEIRDDDLLPILRRLRRRRDGGDRLLAYREPEGWRNISSQDINGYLQTVIGDGYTAKDFRTWHATFLAAVTLGRMSKGEGSRARIIASAIREVSEHLGNTPAVCRASYVDPRVTDAFEDGDHLGAELSEVDLETDPDEARRRIELAVIRLIERQVPSERRAA